MNDKTKEKSLDFEKSLAKLESIIEQTMKGKKPKPGSYRGRVNSEPENNRKTLLDLKNA